MVCRVHERAEAMFMQPCDSRILGSYRVPMCYARVKILATHSLERKAIMVEEDNGMQAVFLVILHEL